MTSRIIVNNIQSDAGISTIFFNSDIGATSGTLNLAGNLNVSGVVTYDDVTNIDSVGVITARSDVSIADKIVHTGDTDTAIRFPGADQVSVETGGTQRLRIASDGTVIVGTDTTVNPILRILGTSAHNSFIQFADGDSNNVGQLQYSHSSNALIVAVNGGEKLRITSDGKMGLGTQTPGDALSISGASAGLGIYNTGNNHGNVYFYKDGTPKGWLKYRGNDDKLVIGNVTDAINVLSSGNVGVDCTPLAKLQVRAGTNANIALTTMSSEASIEAFNDAGSANVSLRLRGSDLKLFTGSTERLRMGSDGKVLIGSDTGSVHGDRLLQVGKTDRGSTYISITSSTSGIGGLLFADTTTNDTGGYRGIIDYTHSNDAMRFFTQATERFSITSNGGLNNGNITISGWQNTHDPDNYSMFLSDNHANTFFGQNLRLGHNGSSGNHQLLVNNQHGSLGGAGMLIGGNGSSYANQLKFFTVPANQSAGTRVDNSAYARMTIGSDGKFYYGTTSQGPHGGFFNIDASSSGRNGINVKGTTANYVMVSSAGGSGGDHIYFSNYSNGNQETGRIKDNSSNVTYHTSSDYRLKDNIVSITDGITRVKQLNPVRHTWINNPALGTVDGWIAHELGEVCPDAVDGEKDAVREDGSIKVQAADYGRITPLLAAALKEAIAKIEALEARVTTLEG